MSERYQLFKYDTCPFCLRVMRFLQQYPQLDVTLRDIYTEPGTMRELVEGGGRTTVPQVFIDGKHVGGSDDLFALESQGKLDAMIAS